MAHDVFISYSIHDKTTADAVCVTLEANGIQCWIAPRDIIPGVDWGEAIIDAIQTSRMMVLVFSSNANDSQQVRREVERAANRGLVIMPLRIENVTPTKSLAYFIGPLHWLDALTPPLERHLQNLTEAVGLQLSRIGKDKGTIESQNSPPEITEEEGRQVRILEQRRTQTQARPARGRFKKTTIGLMVVCSLGVGLTFYGLWHRVDLGRIWMEANKVPGKAEEAKQRTGEATCYDEVAVNSLIVSLQKTKEQYDRDLISINDFTSRRKKLFDDLHHFMAPGPNTEACISQDLVLVRSLYQKDLIDINQWNSSREILWKALHNLLLPKVQNEEDRQQALAIIKQLYDQDAIDINQRNATRTALSDK